MKKLLLSLLFFCFIGGNAQIVNIPDPVFKQRLLNASPDYFVAGILDGNVYNVVAIDTNNDGEISYQEAVLIDILRIENYNSGAGIYDITGLEAFVNLSSLHCGFNSISSIDLNSFPLLEYFTCPNNPISELDFSNLPALVSVGCSGTLVTSLNFENNPLLFDLGCANNINLTEINIENGAYQNTGPGIMQCDTWIGTPNLSIVCADDNEIEPVTEMITWWGSTATVSECNLATNDLSHQQIQIYPNPARGSLNIQWSESILKVELFDISGRKVKSWKDESNFVNIHLNNVSKGLYLVHLQTSSEISTKKIIVD